MNGERRIDCMDMHPSLDKSKKEGEKTTLWNDTFIALLSQMDPV